MTGSNQYHQIIETIIQEIDDNTHKFTNPSVEDGSMGLAIFYYYCHKYYNTKVFLTKAEEMIDVSIQLLSKISHEAAFTVKYKGDSLSNLIASFGKGMLFVENTLGYKYDFTQYYEMIDEILVDLSYKSIEERDFDFFSGALAAGHYFINKFNIYKDETSRHTLLNIYNALVKSGLSDIPDQIYWKAPAYSDQVYLGISHGSAMIINFIVKLFKIGIFNQNDISQKQILEKAINFVMSQKTDFEMGYFPHVYKSDNNIEPTIFAMCYGDLGVLYALKFSSVIIDDIRLMEEVDLILEKSSKRKKDIQHTVDASLFYGASGVYCIYRSLYSNTNDPFFKKVYKYWYSQILTYQDINQKFRAGFTFFINDDDNDSYTQYSFGWGLAGLGICLLLDLDNDLPLLDEILLIGL
ncbi:lanthionine synthetase LanC family protein [Elizabethkingia anophelis]|uniref:lanthionine synthetase LanC family protein n=1 Tax=Elizabethkingia anophelis TaxID=1117645 RepID=UPI000B364AFE|nr:lanthionine synthetase LanC family protein [Elizabethkingia anophelis]MCT3898410.1 hypothetical protein [Elizabethkingia anophelis]